MPPRARAAPDPGWESRRTQRSPFRHSSGIVTSRLTLPLGGRSEPAALLGQSAHQDAPKPVPPLAFRTTTKTFDATLCPQEGLLDQVGRVTLCFQLRTAGDRWRRAEGNPGPNASAWPRASRSPRRADSIQDSSSMEMVSYAETSGIPFTMYHLVLRMPEGRI